MRARLNDELAKWAEAILAEHGGMSLRQAEIRTGISYATISSLLVGRQPNAETIIRFARGFGQDIPTALRLAGYEDIAELWEGQQGVHPPADLHSEGATGTSATYPDPDVYVGIVRETREPVYEDLREAGYDDLPPDAREEVVDLVRFKLERLRRKDRKTLGKRADAEDG